MKKALTIADSDAGGGTGIQADLKTFSARGVFGTSAITALTAQNTLGVQGIYDIEPAFVKKQIDSVMTDMGADAWKTGMLSNAAIVRVVAEGARHYNVTQLVLDPVMVAAEREPLLQEEVQEALTSELIPLASIITPNHHEAEVLTGLTIESVDDMRRAAETLLSMGAQAVVIKGGHLSTTMDAIDVFTDGAQWVSLGVARIPTNNSHGTGCTFASCLAAELAKGHTLFEATFTAKAYLTAALQRADTINIGQGCGPPDHSLGQVPTFRGMDIDLTVLI